MQTVLLLAGGWLVGWVCRSALFRWERDCADPTHGNDAYRHGLFDAADAVIRMIKCDDNYCGACEALDYAAVEIVAMVPDGPPLKDRCPD